MNRPQCFLASSCVQSKCSKEETQGTPHPPCCQDIPDIFVSLLQGEGTALWKKPSDPVRHRLEILHMEEEESCGKF